jgi:hypothetical protein
MGPTYKIYLEKLILETRRHFIVLFDQKLLKESWLSFIVEWFKSSNIAFFGKSSNLLSYCSKALLSFLVC